MNGFGMPFTNTAGLPPIQPAFVPLPTLPYIPDTALPTQLQPPMSLPYIPDTALPTQLQPPTFLPYIPDTALPTQLQPPTSLPYIPDSGLPPSLQGPTLPTLPSDQSGVTAPSGPIEFVGDVLGNTIDFVGDVIKTGADIIWDTGKFILDHLEVGIQYAGDIGGQRTQKKYYEDLGSAQKTSAEAARIKAEAYAAQVAAGTMTAEEAIARGIGLGIDTLAGIPSAPSTSTGPVILTTPTAQAAGPNYLLYAAIGLAAYYLLR